jgi:hypothetical protein
MNMRIIRPRTKAIFNSTSQTDGYPGYRERDGQTVTVLGIIFEDEVDPETGLMYEIEFEDGKTTDAFEDELEIVEQE